MVINFTNFKHKNSIFIQKTEGLLNDLGDLQKYLYQNKRSI
ncbi:hypothetical protein pb186bvf_014417 [Paramecium bursaria]